jgi:sec-independent protein translocase protein TatA
MFGLGMPELVIIMFLVLIFFGAGKLPEIGGAIGKGIKSFKGAVTEKDESARPEKGENERKTEA